MFSLSDIFVHIQKFKTSGLLAHESEINKLKEEGDRLVGMKHPGSPTVKVHLSAVCGSCDQAEYFLGL